MIGLPLDWHLTGGSWAPLQGEGCMDLRAPFPNLPVGARDLTRTTR